MSDETYAALAELPVQVDDWSLSVQERVTTAESVRKTTVVSLQGGGHVGRGEDVTYDPELHEELVNTPPALDLDGEHSLEAASDQLADIDLFPTAAPDRADFRHYRRWAFESALLDLTLKQSHTNLPGAIDSDPDPVRFLVSTGLGDPPSAEPVTRWLDLDPSLEFKVDLTRPPGDDVINTLAETEAVGAIDLKARYAGITGTEIDGDSSPSWIGDPDPDPTFYRKVLEAFPDAIIEDPVVTPATRPLLESVSERLSWDAPVHSVAEFEDQPLEVGWCNVKPSRFGTLEGLCDFIDFATERGVRLYGGGQFELSVGRGQLHALASVWHPDSPNDVAPRAYNDPEPRTGLPSSPLGLPAPTSGFGWPPSDESL